MNKDEFMCELNELLGLVKKGELRDSSVSLFVAECIVDNDDPSLFQLVPENIRDCITDMIEILNENGALEAVSNVGVKDHSELFRRLEVLLQEK